MKTHLHNLVRDLVESRLWPVAVLLVVALGAVPVLLSGGDEPAKPAGATPTAPATSGDAGTAQKAEVTLDTAVPVERDRGPVARNPFKRPASARANEATAPSAGAGASTSTPSAPSSSGGGSDTTAATGATTSTGPTGYTGSTSPATPAQTKPAAPEQTAPKTPAKPKAEDAQDTYHVDLKFGVNGAEPKAIEDVARLSPLPSLTDPFFVFLGVLETKAHQKRAVFLVSSDATPNGEGSCHPTKTDCESVELAVGQTAFFDYAAPDGTLTQYELKLTRIRKTAVHAEAKAAAAIARHSGAGAELLRDAAVRDVRAAAGARAYRYVPALGTLVRAKRRHVSARAAAAGQLIPGLALASHKHQPGIPVWHSPKK
jgi:hypothetical protein